MSPATAEVLQAALALPEEERSELIEELLALQPDSGELPFDPSWLEEIQRHSAEIDGGLPALASWSDVKQAAMARVKQTPVVDGHA